MEGRFDHSNKLYFKFKSHGDLIIENIIAVLRSKIMPTELSEMDKLSVND